MENVRRNVDSRKWEPQSYNHKGLNLANDLLELVSGFLPPAMNGALQMP